MNVLVTGGAGFIGAHLVEKLITSGATVTIVDCLDVGGGIPFVHPLADFIKDDVAAESAYKKLERKKFDAVFHLAAQASAEPAYDDPRKDFLTNGFGSFLVSKFCKEKNIPKLIYTSSAAVYGNTSKAAVKEASSICPDSIYGVSKYSGEMYIKQLLKNEDTSYTIFRVSNTYGPGANLNNRKKGMVNIYTSYLWKSEPIVVKGSLSRFRDFTYIDDTVAALVSVLENPKSNNQTYNLSSGMYTSVRELISMLTQIWGENSATEVVEQEGTPGDSFGFSICAGKLIEELAWEPIVNLKEGLSTFVDWARTVPVIKSLDGYHPLDKNVITR